MIWLIKELRSHRQLVYARLRADIQTTIVDTRLGYVWLLLEPLLLALVYYFVISVVFDRGGPDYYLFILIGLWPWTWFSRSVTQMASAFRRNRSLILTNRAPLSIYVVSPVLLNGVLASIGLICTTLFIDDLSLSSLAYSFFPLLALLALTYAIGVWLALAACFLRDLEMLLTYALRLGFFMSPVIYDVSRILDSQKMPEFLKDAYFLNPMAHLLPDLRAGLFDHEFGFEPMLLVIIALSWVLGELGAYATSRMRNSVVARL